MKALKDQLYNVRIQFNQVKDKLESSRIRTSELEIIGIIFISIYLFIFRFYFIDFIEFKGKICKKNFVI
jgi:hypothetical protein